MPRKGRVRHQTVEPQSRERVGQLGELRRRPCGLDAGPGEAGVHLDEEAHLRAGGGERRRKSARHEVRVADDRDRRLARQRREPLGLRRADEREGEQDVADPRGLHHLGLAELLAGDADGSGAKLHVRDRGQLVRLDMRAEGQRVLVAIALHTADVALDRIQVDRRDGRVQRRDVHLSRRARRPRRPRRRSRRGRTGSSCAPASARRRSAGTRHPSRRSAPCR